jgi:hypothetical protein
LATSPTRSRSLCQSGEVRSRPLPRLRREADLLDHYWQVQREAQAFNEAQRWARRARRQASWALWSAATAILLAVIALLTG